MLKPYTPFQAFVDNMKVEYPTFKVVRKEDSGFMHFLNYFVGLWNKDFMSLYTTTIGKTVYMPWQLIDTYDGYCILRHEAIHVRQADEHPIWYPLSYLFLLPCFFTYRSYWEIEAYTEDLKIELEATGQISEKTIQEIEGEFSGPSYLWMATPSRAKTLVSKAVQAAKAAVQPLQQV